MPALCAYMPYISAGFASAMVDLPRPATLRLSTAADSLGSSDPLTAGPDQLYLGLIL